MPKYPRKKDRYRDQFLMIKGWEQTSPAFKALLPNDVRVYIELRRRYNGRNNGKISLSAREAGELLHKSHTTGARALIRLRAYGFIKIRKESTFDQKRMSREYELTAISMEPAKSAKSLPPGSKEFMKISHYDFPKIEAKFKLGKAAKLIPSNTDDVNSSMCENKGDNIYDFPRVWPKQSSE